MTDPITPSQEAVTSAVLAALIACGALTLAIIDYLELTSLLSYAVLAMMTAVVAGYVVPNVVAFWLGRPLHDIMTEEPSYTIRTSR